MRFIQRITEIYMVLPFLPILIMVGVFYSRSIWVMLVVVIAQHLWCGHQELPGDLPAN
jgi:peptide/nickel transport system permease protein